MCIFNCLLILRSFGFVVNYIVSDSVIVDVDLFYLMVNVDDNNGEGNFFLFIGYLNCFLFDYC